MKLAPLRGIIWERETTWGQFGSLGSFPAVGERVTDAAALIQMGRLLTAGGVEMLDALIPIADGLRSSLSPPAAACAQSL